MNKTSFLFFIIINLLLFSCAKPKLEADLILINGKIYSVDESFTTNQTAFAVKDGKFLETGSSKDIKSRYKSSKIIDAKGKAVYPGFYDAHCHFYGLGMKMQSADLVGTKSYAEVLQKLKEFRKKNLNSEWLQGRGWDQNDWETKRFPTKRQLDALFPDTPVFLTRIDGHAALVNQKALEIAGVKPNTKVDGGKILLENNEMTGVFIDNAIDLIRKHIPKPKKEERINILKQAEKACFEVGLTTVTDAGLDKDIINLIDELHKNNELNMNVYAMANPEDRDYFFNRGFIKTDKLQVRSFKIYADGALGSRGACLLSDYNDHPNNKGFLLTKKFKLKELISSMAENGFQINTHCIGDSANRLLLDLYADVLKGENDKRWRIEHAQVVTVKDQEKFGKYNVIPSVQPTHATSDMYWAGDRLGNNRVKTAYAYKDLLKQNGILAFGSDFPVENINPIYGFHAATARQDAKGYPKKGFQTENSVSRETALKAMTAWAAYANFEEKDKGSIEPGKFADFVILEKDIMTIPLPETRNVKVKATYIKGNKVFGKE